MSNFQFLNKQWPEIFELAKEAEHMAFSKPRSSLFNTRLALEKGMLGVAMTNTAALGVPTFGRHVMFGTNPLAFAAPANKEKAFVLDMSTTVITRGKIEVYNRKGEELEMGWAVDKTGRPANDAGTQGVEICVDQTVYEGLSFINNDTFKPISPEIASLVMPFVVISGKGYFDFTDKFRKA